MPCLPKRRLIGCLLMQAGPNRSQVWITIGRRSFLALAPLSLLIVDWCPELVRVTAGTAVLGC